MKIIYLNLLSKSLFIAFVTIIIISCNQSDETKRIKCDTAPIISKSELENLGLTVPLKPLLYRQITFNRDIHKEGTPHIGF